MSSSPKGESRCAAEHEDLSEGEVFDTFVDCSNVRNYHPPISDNVEDVEKYRRSGYQPVDIGDELADGTYKIIHKLGHGDFSTVWLAYDRPKARYVAIKIVTADFSHEAMVKEERIQQLKLKFPPHIRKTFSLALRYLWITGVNGRHFAIISDVRGPSLARLLPEIATSSNTWHRLSCSVIQRLAFQITEAVSYLHLLGLAHGDLTCNNVLLEVKPLNHLSPEHLLERLGHPRAEKIRIIDQSSAQHAPGHVVEPADTLGLLQEWTGNVKIIGFGSSYSLAGLPNFLNTPLTSCAPEYLLLNEVGSGSDIWALGVLIYKLRMNADLFVGIMEDTNEVLSQMEEVLGPIPYYQSYSAGTSSDSENNLVGELPKIPMLSELIMRAWWGSFKQFKRSISAAREQQLTTKGINDVSSDSFDVYGELQLESNHQVDMSAEEARLFLDLMTGTLHYNAKRRLSAEEMLSHPWLSRKFW